MEGLSLWSKLAQSVNVPGISFTTKVNVKDRHLAIPNVSVPDIFVGIDWKALRIRGFEGILFNKDKTLTAPYGQHIWPPLTDSLEECREVFGGRIALPSNSAGSSSSSEYVAGQQRGLSSTSLEQSTSRSGRRAFSTLCLFAFAVFPITGKIGDALSEETQAKPEKKKGRAPSSPYDEDRLLEQNRRMQKLNNAPTEFPGFVREGFQVKVITGDKYVTSKSGLIYYDMVVGNGDLPQDGQQVIFHYTGYNESGRRVDSSYQQGRPARTRLGIQGMIPGFEEGIKSMRAGGRRIIIVPPELGPPVGPSTFFSAKQFEVFDVELLETKECTRRTLLFYSDVVCD